MTIAGMRWYAPVPTDPDRTRTLIDFGLRSADLFFRDLVVPGLGRVWFVRQLSWSVAAISLAETLRAEGLRTVPGSTLANAMEALGCKLAWSADPATRRRILGSRAFARERDDVAWGFRRLRRPAAYVRQTHRQNASRALRVDGGLGLAQGPRFDRLVLEPAGEVLAKVVLDQPAESGTLHTWLSGWVTGEKIAGPGKKTLRAALSPFTPTEAERALVRGRVLDVEGPTGDTRRALARALTGSGETPRLEDVVVPRLRKAGRAQQAEALLAAVRFGALLDRARDLAAVLTQHVEGQGASALPLDRLVRDREVIATLDRLKEAARAFLTQRERAGVEERESERFAKEVVGTERRAVLEKVIRRLDPLLVCVDGGVTRGARFRVLEDARTGDTDPDDAEPDRTGRTFRTANLVSLLRDLEAT